MTFTIYTHDSWGLVTVGHYRSLEEARVVFQALCNDPWYKDDGTVKGVELVQDAEGQVGFRIDWFPFQ
jgi:hypothetical protein